MFRKLRDKLEQEVNQRGYSDAMKTIESAVASFANKNSQQSEPSAINGDLKDSKPTQVEQFSSSIDRALLEQSPNHSSDSPLNLLEDDVFSSNSNLDSPAILTVSSPEPTSPLVRDPVTTMTEPIHSTTVDSSGDSPEHNVATEELITLAESTVNSPPPTISQSPPPELTPYAQNDTSHIEKQLKEENDTLRAQLKQLTDKHQKDQQSWRNESESIQKQLKQLKEQLDRENHERTKLSDRNSILAEEINRLQGRDKSERAARKELQEEIAAEKAKTDQAKADLIVAKDNLSKVQQRCDQLTKQAQEQLDHSKSWEKEKQGLQQKMADLERMLNDRDKSSQDLSDKFKQERIALKLENSRLKELSSTYNSERQLLSERVTDLEKRMNRVNHEYLKNVVFKFVTSVEIDAQRHLIKAISAVLNFSPDEDRLAKEMIEWKASWLASLPIVGAHSRPMPAFSDRSSNNYSS